MNIRINNNKFVVKTMITPKDKSTGMMGKKFTSPNQGMLFLMDDGEHCFWMKGCVTPLDIIFIQDNKITTIHSNCEPCRSKDCGNYCGEGNLVLELPGGTCKKIGIKKGDLISF